METKAYIFDLDGTLVDSMTGGWIKMLKEFLVKRNVQFTPQMIKRGIALGLYGVAQDFKERFGFTESVEEIVAQFRSVLRVKYETVIPQKSNVRETLVALKARGVSLNVLTASPHEFLDPSTKRLGLYELFDNVWSIEDFSTTKADPLIYKTAAERLGLPLDSCVMVDDSVAALKPAKEAGMKTIGVYDEFSAGYEAEMRAIADQYIYDFKELL
ncbi:MAG: HAD family phosphatase [Clostridia bacterium]|nr:HAD family phosphatase [Clostridia bacterium]